MSSFDKPGQLRAEDASGAAVSGALLYVYAAGTTTPITTYSDSALTTPHADPVVADSSGTFPPIYAPTARVKIDMKTSAGVSLPGHPVDNYDLIQSEDILRSDELVSGYQTLTSATAYAPSIPIGRAVEIFGHTTAGDGGDFKAIREASVDSTYPGGGVFRPLTSVNPAMYGAVLDGATSDDTALSDTASFAIANNRDVFVGGKTTKMAARRNAIAGANRVGQGIITLPDATTTPWQVGVNKDPLRFSFSDDTATTQISAGTRYEAFPRMVRLGNGHLLAVWWEGTDHSAQQPAGNNQGDTVGAISKDGGMTFGTPFVIAGNLDGPDATFSYSFALGVDADGGAVLVYQLFNGVTQARPYITRSPDGEVWSVPIEVTMTNDTYSDNRSIFPFGSITALPSGKLLVGMYAGDRNWAGIIEASAPSTIDLSSLVVDTDGTGDTYSEFLLCALNEAHWISVIREDGTVNASPVYETTDAGTTWTDIGTTNLPTSGGYVPQDLFAFTVGGQDHIGLLMGLRSSASAPPDGAPGIGLYVALADQLRTASDTIEFVPIHNWGLAVDSDQRDAYGAAVVDQTTRSIAVVVHNETASTRSNVRFGAASIGDMLSGAALSVSETWPTTMEIKGSSTDGTQVYVVRTNRHSLRGNVCRAYLRFQVSSGDFTGNMEIHNLPFEIGEDFEANFTTATNLANLIERVSIRGTAGDTFVTVLERDGTSGLSLAEINNGSTSDFRIEFDYVVARQF